MLLNVLLVVTGMARSRVCNTAVPGSSLAGSAGDSADEWPMLAFGLTCTGSLLDSEVFNDEVFLVLVRCSLPVVKKFASRGQ